MKTEQRPGAQSTGLGRDAESRALDRFENEGGPGPHDTRDVRRDASTSGTAGDHDIADSGRVLLGLSDVGHAFEVHHRDFPELRADGVTPREAIANLTEDLTREIEGVADHYHRKLLERALKDVRAFADQSD